jgi:hypothetical protein
MNLPGFSRPIDSLSRLSLILKHLLEQIWLGSLGKARPAGARVPVNGSPTGTIKSGGKYEFQVWKGVVNVPVISIFPAEEGRRFTSFSGDLKKLLRKLPHNPYSQPFLIAVLLSFRISCALRC